MTTLTATQQDILAGRLRGILALLLTINHPDGILRLSTLPYAWTDAGGATWTGGAGILSFGSPYTRHGIEGGALPIVLSGALEALLAVALDTRVQGSAVTQSLALIREDGTQAGSNIIVFRGVAEAPEIDADPANPTITITAESVLLRLARPRPYRLTPASHQRYFATDTGFDFVSGLQDRNVFGEDR